MTHDEEAEEIVRRLKGIFPVKESDVLWVDFIIRPTKPVEFIYLNMIIKKEEK